MKKEKGGVKAPKLKLKMELLKIKRPLTKKEVSRWKHIVSSVVLKEK